MNALAELLKQLTVTSIPAMPSMPFTSTPPNMQSDIISRLSAELRHIVYSDLNIPVEAMFGLTAAATLPVLIPPTSSSSPMPSGP